jgi:hypothetical protein
MPRPSHSYRFSISVYATVTPNITFTTLYIQISATASCLSHFGHHAAVFPITCLEKKIESKASPSQINSKVRFKLWY